MPKKKPNRINNIGQCSPHGKSPVKGNVSPYFTTNCLNPSHRDSDPKRKHLRQQSTALFSSLSSLSPAIEIDPLPSSLSLIDSLHSPSLEVDLFPPSSSLMPLPSLMEVIVEDSSSSFSSLSSTSATPSSKKRKKGRTPKEHNKREEKTIENIYSKAMSSVRSSISTSYSSVCQTLPPSAQVTYQVTIKDVAFSDVSRSLVMKNDFIDTVSKSVMKTLTDDHRIAGKKLLYMKLKHSMSSRCLQDFLAVVGVKWKAWSIKKLQRDIEEEMASCMIIYETQNKQMDAAFFNPLQMLRSILPQISFSAAQLEISLSGDGRRARRYSGVVLSLKLLLNEKENQLTKWVLPFAVAKGSERRQNLEFLLEAVNPYLRQIPMSKFSVSHSSIEILLRFCSDGKFQLLVMGLVAANGTASCPYCVLPKEQWADAIYGDIDANLYLRKSSKELSKLKNDHLMCPAHVSVRSCHSVKSKHGVTGNYY